MTWQEYGPGPGGETIEERRLREQRELEERERKMREIEEMRNRKVRWISECLTLHFLILAWRWWWFQSSHAQDQADHDDCSREGLLYLENWIIRAYIIEHYPNIYSILQFTFCCPSTQWCLWRLVVWCQEAPGTVDDRLQDIFSEFYRPPELVCRAGQIQQGCTVCHSPHELSRRESWRYSL